MVNNFYIYCVDRDFGPFFLKFCSYFPYSAKLCLNGHEWLKRQLKHRGIGFEALDNGLLSCDDPKRAQAVIRENLDIGRPSQVQLIFRRRVNTPLSDALSAEKVDALLRKWLRRLPHPYSPADRTTLQSNTSRNSRAKKEFGKAQEKSRVFRTEPQGRLPVPDLDFASGVFPDPGARPAQRQADCSSRRPC
jgi:hypothetical protein